MQLSLSLSFLFSTSIALVLAITGTVISAGAAETAANSAAIKSVHDVTMNGIDGKPVALSHYKGSVIMLVNVASKCGNTKQYKPLEALYDTYKERGLVIIGVPANNFKGQEPGTNEEIATFCKATYGVSFPLLAKVSVKGDDICPLYKYLTTSSAKPGEITWNFEKFLIGRDGQVINRFSPKTQPDDATVIAALEAALAAK